MILLFGARGYMGGAFAAELDRRGMAYEPVTRADAGPSDVRALAGLLKSRQASFVINAAGFTGRPNVDACETEKSDTLLGNVVFAHVLTQACAIADIPVGHVASGCVYNGCLVREGDGWSVETDMAGTAFRRRVEHEPDGIRGFDESAEPNFSFRHPPCSFYSGSKALAEELIRDSDHAYLWRLRMPFDEHDGPRNYLGKLQRYAKLYDNFNSLSHRGDFVRAALDLWEHRASRGIYNLTNPGFVRTSEVTAMIGDILGVDHRFEFFTDADEFYSQAAVAPRSNCILDTDKAAAAGVSMRPVRDALRAALEEWVPEASAAADSR
jgi:UDP-glucose 4,6-dehydratase